MFAKRCAAGLGLVLLSLLFVAPATAQVTCIQQYYEQNPLGTAAFEPSEFEEIVFSVAHAIGLSGAGIHVVPCAGTKKVLANYYAREDIPTGDYIIYEPVWMREVIGLNISNSSGNEVARGEAIFVIGHELGHILERHFTANASMPKLEQELAADKFAGCAAARMSVVWEIVAGFIARGRGDIDTTHPSRDNSLAVAREGFDRCRSVATPVPDAPQDDAWPEIPGLTAMSLNTNPARAEVAGPGGTWWEDTYYTEGLYYGVPVRLSYIADQGKTKFVEFYMTVEERVVEQKDRTGDEKATSDMDSYYRVIALYQNVLDLADILGLTKSPDSRFENYTDTPSPSGLCTEGDAVITHDTSSRQHAYDIWSGSNGIRASGSMNSNEFILRCAFPSEGVNGYDIRHYSQVSFFLSRLPAEQ